MSFNEGDMARVRIDAAMGDVPDKDRVTMVEDMLIPLQGQEALINDLDWTLPWAAVDLKDGNSWILNTAWLEPIEVEEEIHSEGPPSDVVCDEPEDEGPFRELEPKKVMEPDHLH